MLSKYVKPGDKVEVQAVERVKFADEGEKKKVYASMVSDILSDDQLEIVMPMEKSKLILLPVNAEYDVYFYTESGLYQCFVKVIDRYKQDNQYILLLELTSNLRKFQRREYYRLGCALEMSARPLEKEEIRAVENNDKYLVPGLPLKRLWTSAVGESGLSGITVMSRIVWSVANTIWQPMERVKNIR